LTAPTTPSRDSLDLMQKRQSSENVTPLSRRTRPSTRKISPKTNSGPMKRILKPGGGRCSGPSNSIPSLPSELKDHLGAYELDTGNPISSKKTRYLNSQAKIHATRVRRHPGGACPVCKRSKRKCNHVLEEDKAESSLNLESPGTRLNDEGPTCFKAEKLPVTPKSMPKIGLPLISISTAGCDFRANLPVERPSGAIRSHFPMAPLEGPLKPVEDS